MSKHHNHIHKQLVYLSNIDLEAAGSRYGGKTKSLVIASKNGACVPKGVAVSTELSARIAASKDVDRYIKVLAPVVLDLLDGSQTGKLIVRSSSIYEGNASGIFSGLFDSYLNIERTEDVVSAICKIIFSSRLQSLKPYFERFKLDINSKHMAVLIQPQVSYDVGGIAQFSSNGCLVEYSISAMGDALSGKEPPHWFFLDINKDVIHSPFKTNEAIDAAIRNIRSAFRQQQEFWNFAVREKLAVEFVLQEDSLLVLQTKRGVEGSYQNDSSAEEFGKSVYANKSFAMRFFSDNGLFTRPCKLLKSRSPKSAVKAALNEILAGNKIATIRFAKGSAISLPRAFVTSASEGSKFIDAFGKNDYEIIIHDYINVARSFEILVSDSGYVLEHVPGMWESPSKLQPDVIIKKGTRTRTYRYLRNRKAVIERNSDIEGNLDIPITPALANDFKEFGDEIYEVVRTKLRKFLPLNIHAVLDGTSMSYQCINIRPGFKFEVEIPELGNLFVVKTPTDLDRWNGIDPVRLSVATNRGEERVLIGMATTLAKSKLPVITDFGLLSHPAMVLREYGCKLIPSYMIPTNLKDYDVIQEKSDAGSEPVQRIFGEEAMVAHPVYHVVKDRDPISGSHFLCVSKAFTPSASDTNQIDELAALFKSLCGNDDALYFERGRATFCTSGLATPHDHFHIVKEIDICKTVESLKHAVGGKHFKTLHDAYDGAPKIGEYTVFGSTETGFFVRSGGYSTKRLLRSCIAF